MRPGAQELARQPTLIPAHRSLGAGAKPMQSLSAVRKAPSSEGVFAFCHNPHPGTNPAGAGARRPPVGISRPTAGISARRLHLPTKAKAALAVCRLSIGPETPAGDHYSGGPAPTSCSSPQGRPSGVRYHLDGSRVHKLFSDG